MHVCMRAITKQNQEVVILSDNVIISTAQTNLLRKGLSFIPKPKQLNTIDLYNDIQKFKITARRKVRNHNKQFTRKHNPFKSKQYKEHLNEHIPINKTLDTALCRIREELINECNYKQNKHDNLTRKERKALNELIHNPHLVINKADEGTTVVETRQQYIKNAKAHLSNPQVYNRLQQDPTHTLKEKNYA